MAEMELCLHNQVSRGGGGLPESSVSNGRRVSTTTVLAGKRKYPWSIFATVGVLLVAVCCWVEFILGKRSISILPSTTRVEVDDLFVQEIQRAYDKHHLPNCASLSSSKTVPCDTGGGGTILSLQCQDRRAPTVGDLVQQSLATRNPTLVCANEAVSSTSLSLQTILEQKYDLVLVESHKESSKDLEKEQVHDNVDFWKTMLLPRGILALFCCSELVHKESPGHRKSQAPPTSVDLMAWSSPQHQDEFLSRFATLYKAKICSPRNKQGLFCQGDILSLDCNHNPSLKLLQEYMPGRGTLYCPQNPKTSSSKKEVISLKFQNQVPLTELFHRRYATIMLDTSQNYPNNLELWSQLLVPGGIIAIDGTSTENPIPSDQYLKKLDLKAYYSSSTPPYFLFFVNTQPPAVDVSTTNQARVDETAVLNQYQPNQGRVDTQIQLSPVSFEDRYPAMYRRVADELLQTSSSSSCTKGNNNKKNRIGTDSSSSSACGPTKVLSFGCSYGFEMKSLADKYLTGKADIYGVDVNDAVVAKAQENVKIVDTNKMVVLHGKTDPASNYGPFDAVFANSVLCYNRFPEPKDPVAKIKSMFTFATFEGLLQEIDVLVKVGGFLSLDNTNYLFNQTSLFQDKYQTYRDQENPLCRQDVWLLDKNGKVVFNPRTDNRSAFTVYCVFVKVKE